MTDRVRANLDGIKDRLASGDPWPRMRDEVDLGRTVDALLAVLALADATDQHTWTGNVPVAAIRAAVAAHLDPKENER